MSFGYPNLPEILPEEQQRVWIARLPDREARNILVTGYLQMVARIVGRYPPDVRERLDLFSVGVLELIRAIDRYDPSRGMKLSSFAYAAIWGYVAHAVRSEAIRYRRLGVALSLERPLGEKGDRLSSRIPDPSDRVRDCVARMDLERALSLPGLDDRARSVIGDIAAQGADADMAEIGARYGLTRGRVRKIMQEARPILRERMSVRV